MRPRLAAEAWGRSDTVFVAATDARRQRGLVHQQHLRRFRQRACRRGPRLRDAEPRRGLLARSRASRTGLEPGKRPFHTHHSRHCCMRENAVQAAFGVTGGFMQPQGHLQLVVNLLDYGLDRAERDRRAALLVGGGAARRRSRPACRTRRARRWCSWGHEIAAPRASRDGRRHRSSPRLRERGLGRWLGASSGRLRDSDCEDAEFWAGRSRAIASMSS